MRAILFALLAACGGGAKSAPLASTGIAGGAPKSECAVTAAHVAEAVFTWKEPPPTTKENVAQVITERCEGDQWSAEAKACFGKITDEESTKPCIGTLTKEQHDKVMNAMEAKFDHESHEPPAAQVLEEGKMGRGSPKPASSPPPPPPAKGGPAKGADPCEGGE